MRVRDSSAAIVLVVLAAAAGLAAQAPIAPSTQAAPARLALTVDSIMRGPDLVGYPPSGLRWSGDSRDLFFEWRKPATRRPQVTGCLR